MRVRSNGAAAQVPRSRRGHAWRQPSASSSSGSSSAHLAPIGRATWSTSSGKRAHRACIRGRWSAVAGACDRSRVLLAGVIDVALVRRSSLEAVVVEVWDWFDDVGAGLRGLDAKSCPGSAPASGSPEAAPDAMARPRSLRRPRDATEPPTGRRAEAPVRRPVHGSSISWIASACRPAQRCRPSDGLLLDRRSERSHRESARAAKLRSGPHSGPSSGAFAISRPEHDASGPAPGSPQLLRPCPLPPLTSPRWHNRLVQGLASSPGWVCRPLLSPRSSPKPPSGS